MLEILIGFVLIAAIIAAILLSFVPNRPGPPNGPTD